MATTILGIDLGSYSVKVARLDVSFRSTHLISLEEHRVPRPKPHERPGDASEGSHGDPHSHGETPGEGHEEGSGEGSAEGAADAGDKPAPVEHVPWHPLSSDDDTLLQRQLRTLELALHNQRGKGETSVVALGGEVTLRLVEMPFADAKKVAQALPFELAGQLMTDLDDQIVDQVLSRPMPVARPSAIGGAPAGLGIEGEPSSLWLAACAPRPLVQERLAALGALGLDPRLCAATALAGAALFVQTVRKPAKPGKGTQLDLPLVDSTPELPLWVIDLGHRTTHVCAVALHPTRSGQVLVPFARTMARGGEHLTQALARALEVDFGRAEDLKHMHGIAEDAEPRVVGALREALRPLIRDLRQTLAAYVGRYGDPPRSIHLTGGTAQLTGLPELISHELGIEVKPLLPPNGAPWLQSAQRDTRAAMSLGASDDAAMRTHLIAGPALVRRWPTGATAVGLALAGAIAAPQLNFRKGDLGYRNDYAFVREKAPYLAAFAAALLCCVVIWAWASLRVLEKESERLRLQLISESTALFGEPRTNGRLVSAELASVLAADKGTGQSIPTVSVLDIIEDISRAAPKTSAAGPTRLDVVDLSIRPKKTEIKATAGSAQYVDDLAAALGKLPCFKSVQKGKVLTVRNIGPDNKPFDVKQFSLEITTTCP